MLWVVGDYEIYVCVFDQFSVKNNVFYSRLRAWLRRECIILWLFSHQFSLWTASDD